MVNLFILLPESEPSNQWMLSNESFQEEDGVITFMQSLKKNLDAITLEEFEGYYDNINVKRFLQDFEELEDYYPNPTFKLLRSFLKSWNNWREEFLQDTSKEYSIFSQRIEDHTFCEIAERKFIFRDNKFCLLNHFGHSLGDRINMDIDNTSIEIQSVASKKELIYWFAQERIPTRNFQIIEKHGENREEVIIWRGRSASPLRCSQQEAFELLKFAIGDNIDELFNYDEIDGQGYFIVFKFEGDNPQNMYHGYHLPLDTSEISNEIKGKLLERNNNDNS